MRLVQISNGVVVNVSVDNTREVAPQGWQQSDTAHIGWVFNGEDFTRPSPKAPSEDEVRLERIEFLKQALLKTDYIILPDYDKDKSDVLAQRQAWREEIRSLRTLGGA